MLTSWVLTVSRLALISFSDCLVFEILPDSMAWLAFRLAIAAFCWAMSFWSAFCLA
jgi:hypothetical protein